MLSIPEKYRAKMGFGSVYEKGETLAIHRFLNDFDIKSVGMKIRYGPSLRDSAM